MPPSPPLGYGPATVFFHTFNFPDKCGFNTNASLFSRNPLSISTVFGSDISLRRDSRTRFLPTSPVFDAPLGGSRRNIAITFGVEKLEWCGYQMVKIIDDMFIRFDRIHESDRLTTRDDTGRAYAWHRAAIKP